LANIYVGYRFGDDFYSKANQKKYGVDLSTRDAIGNKKPVR
jgi:hypothetical protein